MSENNGDVIGKDPATGQFKPGHTMAKGRPLGSRNWNTVFSEAMVKIAAANNKTPEELEIMLQEVGINRALRGDHRYWSELQKRNYGDIQKQVHVTTDDEPSDKIKRLAEAINED